MDLNVEWIAAPELTSERLTLEPLQVEHATEMAALLNDVALHEFIGGEPATLDVLGQRYERQVVGHSPDGSEVWLNWVLRRRDTGEAVGTAQATITGYGDDDSGDDDSGDDDAGGADDTGARDVGHGTVADVAWVIAVPAQRQGYAREAAQAVVTWLGQQGIEVIAAFVHPEHEASMSVARAIGLTPTDVVVDGEVRWQS